MDVTITPELGYEIDEIYYTYDVGGSVADPKFGIDNGSFTMPGTDVTIVSSFKPCVFNITTHVNPGDEAGSIQVASSAAFGSEVEVTATPAQGYVLKEIYYTYDAGGGVADPKFGIRNGKFTMIAVDITVVAVFEPVTEYNVIVSADMANGSVQADINAAAGEPMRYFDLQGRYIGTSLDGARRGI